MKITQREYLVGVSAFSYFGPRRTNLLLKYFKDAENIWKADPSILRETGLKETIVSAFIKFRNNFDINSYISRLAELKISYLIRTDSQYPDNLKEIEDAPLVIYFSGRLLPEDKNAVAVVGSRKMTSYGKQTAGIFTRDLTECGITIVSGLARGIDTVAHQEAISAGGRTIAVVAGGLDRIYPPENLSLFRQICRGFGAVISEYPLGYPALPVNFPNRNRIISGLSKAVLVIEGEKASGTLLTATAAANQGRTVFAVCGQITSPLSAAPHFLIENGAKIAFSSRDIIEELNLEIKTFQKKKNITRVSDPVGRKICNILLNEDHFLDEIVRISGLSVAIISAKLTMMIIQGIIVDLGGGKYGIKNGFNYC